MFITSGLNRAISTFVRSNGNKDTVIVVLGFAGAKDVYVQKYAEIYQNKGYDTIKFTAKLPDSYNMKLKYTREVSSAAEHLKEALKDKDIAFHSFSMNGVFSLCSLQLQCPELNLLARSRGIFFDSGPVDLGFSVIIPSMIVMDRIKSQISKDGTLAGKLEYKKRKYKEFFRLVQHYSILPFRRSMGMNVDDISAFDFLCNHPDMPNILSFAYSMADPICDYRSIVAFIAHHRAKGCQVDELFLQDSPHVDHLRKYPKEYMEMIDRFLERISLPRK